MLARQVRVLAIAVEECGRLRDMAGHVEQLVAVDAGHRASGDIAHHVAASAHGGEAGALETLENLGELVERDVMKLDVLPGRQLALIAAVFFGNLADRAQPRGRQDAARDLDAHHEGADFRLVVVHAEPLQPHDVLFGERLVGGRDQPVPLVGELGGEEVVLQALDGVALENQIPGWGITLLHRTIPIQGKGNLGDSVSQLIRSLTQSSIP